MSAILATYILPALLPALGDGLRGIFAKLTGSVGAQPQSVDERIKLMDAETKRLQALAELDKPADNISAWVANLRASFRYFAVAGILAATVAALYTGVDPVAVAMLLDMSGACMSFIIGERMYLNVKRGA